MPIIKQCAYCNSIIKVSPSKIIFVIESVIINSMQQNEKLILFVKIVEKNLLQKIHQMQINIVRENVMMLNMVLKIKRGNVQTVIIFL